jgi:hypothetical protein
MLSAKLDVEIGLIAGGPSPLAPTSLVSTLSIV